MVDSKVLEKIKEKLKDPNTQISIRKLPHYIASFIKEDKDVIFICNELPKAEKNNSLLNHKETHNGTDITFDGDITGNPLEAPISKFEQMNFSCAVEIFNEQSESSNHFPLSAIQARSVLCHCALNVKPSLPVWILTDAKDFKKFVLLSFYTDGNWITRGWVIDLGLMANPELKYLLKKHSEFSSRPHHMASCEGRCSYVIRRESVLDDPSLLRSVLSLQVSWTTMSLEPTLAIGSTEVKLNAKVRIGHAAGGLGVLWEQLCLLDKYLNLISDTNHDISLPSCEAVMKFLTKKTRDGSPLSRVRSTLTEPVQSCDVHINSEVSLSTLTEHYLLNEDPASITDRLWLLFIECKTAKELSSCLWDFYVELKKKDIPKPFIGATNITRLGAELLNGGRSINDPVKYLVEMGLEKLRKELLQMFSNARLASTLALKIPNLPNFSEITGSEWMSATRKWHLWLCQVHCTLEILLNIQVSLGLTNAALSSLVPGILANYMGKNSKIDSISCIIENPVQDVVSEISISHVHEILLKNPTDEWVFTLTTTTEFQKYHNTFYKCPWNNFPTVDNFKHLNDTFCPNELMYYWYEYGSVSEYFNS